MAAPMGTWNINANGNSGILILSASTTGGITGTVFGDPVTAVWDETSQILSFSRARQGDPNPFIFEVYTGTLFQPYATPNGEIKGEGMPLTLAGQFGVWTTGGQLGPFNQLAWFATNQLKFKEKEGKEAKDSKDQKDKDKDKEQKDFKEKEGFPEKLPEFKGAEAMSQTDMAAAMEMRGDPTPGVRIATGKSFISAEERPQVGAAALYDSTEAT